MSCTHTFRPCSVERYVKCSTCHTYRAVAPIPPEILYRSDYWSHSQGHSTLREQVYNCDEHRESGRTKIEYALSQIDPSLDRSAVLDIGCAPGVLLRRLSQDMGFKRVVGIETEPAWESEIREISDHSETILFGFFPEVTMRIVPMFSLVIGLDVFEHVSDPGCFVKECYRLLNPGGQVLLMAPIITPGEEMEPRMFNHIEHIWLHSRQHVTELLTEAGFSNLRWGRWASGHETVSGRKL